MKKLAVVEIEDGKTKEWRKISSAKRKEDPLKTVKSEKQLLGSIWEIEIEKGNYLIACDINHSQTRYSPEWIKKGEGMPEYYEQLIPSLWGWTKKIPKEKDFIELKVYDSLELRESVDREKAPKKMERWCKKIIKVEKMIFICELDRHQLAILEVTP